MKKVTGAMVYYYLVCKRKLWFFVHDLQMENNSELVEIGKIVDENAYSRENKHLLIDDTISVDFLDGWKIVHEIKKSRKIEEASIEQLKYYMMILKDKGLDIEKGILDYPLLRKREIVELTKEDVDKLRLIIKDIQDIILMKVPPSEDKGQICKKCAYYEMCKI